MTGPKREKKKGSDLSVPECQMEAFDTIGTTNLQFRVIEIPPVPPSFGVPISSKLIKIYTRLGFALCRFPI